MPLEQHTCVVCGSVFTRYAYPNRIPTVCSRTCQYERIAANHKAPWLSELNIQPGRNQRISNLYADKIRAGQPRLGQSNGKTYGKWHGRHEHRVVAEALLGRPLLPGEIVHHIDHNKRNNAPDNLLVMTQSEHARLHQTGKKRGRISLPVQDKSI